MTLRTVRLCHLFGVFGRCGGDEARRHSKRAKNNDGEAVCISGQNSGSPRIREEEEEEEEEEAARGPVHEPSLRNARGGRRL
ncbi:unnamed protein product [Arctogadus glacialis]